MSRLINDNLANLSHSYLFARTSKAVADYRREHPQVKIIDLGIGDVRMPLSHDAMRGAALAAWELSCPKKFHGYGPYAGYPFLREAIAKEYRKDGIMIDPEEVYITNGAKGELFALLSLFRTGITSLIGDPVYPAYADANAILGNRVVTCQAQETNGFRLLPGDEHGELIYLCSPNNPTGAVLGRREMKAWIKRAREENSVILFDAAYRSFTRDKEPKSIFEFPEARTCAIEIGSFSKSAGFTGVRCGWTVIPKELTIDRVPMRELYDRRLAVAENGVSYLVQRAASGALRPRAQKQQQANIHLYKKNAGVLAKALEDAGLRVFGSESSPYVWFCCPKGMTSEQAFTSMLEEAALVATPGSGFGAGGEGYMRLSAFCTEKDANEAATRIVALWR